MFKIAADVADAAATADAAVPAEQPKFDPQEEMNLLKSWKTTGDNKHLSELLTRYTPLIKKNSRAFYGADVPKPAIDAEAKQVAIQAFTNFDPTRGVKLSTYVSSYMPKIRRYVIKHQNPVRISEDLSMRVGRYRQSEDELTQKLGRAPAAQEVADHNSWSLRDVRKIRMAAQGANLNETADFVPAQESGERKAMIFIDYLYHELDGEQKKVLEHLYGLHGAQKAETSEKISELSGFPVGRVNRLRSQISEKMQANLGQT